MKSKLTTRSQEAIAAAQPIGDGLGDLGLHGEDIRRRAVPAVGPKAAAGAGVD